MTTAMLTTTVRIFDAELTLLKGPFQSYGVLRTERSSKEVALSWAQDRSPGDVIEVVTELRDVDYSVADSTTDLFEVHKAERIFRPYGPHNPTGSYRGPVETWVKAY